MKATVVYSDGLGKRRQKTIEVEKNEPNHIVREFIKETKLSKYTYVRTIDCGRYQYDWRDLARAAGIE